MNNIERIRESFKALPIELSYDKLLVAAEKFHSIAVVDEYRKKIETLVALCSQDIIDRIYQILSKVITNMEMEMKNYLFHVIEAPETSNLEQTCQPVFIFLNNQLLPYREVLTRVNFNRLLELIWAVLIDQLLAEVEQKTTTVSERFQSIYSNNLQSLFREHRLRTHECLKHWKFSSNISVMKNKIFRKKFSKPTNIE